MSGWFPVNLQHIELSVITAAANVTTVRAVVAAPGAGFRLRLWGYAFGPNDTAQAPLSQRGDVRTPANVVYAQVETSGYNGRSIFLPGGRLWPTNTALNVLDQSSLAALGVTHLVYYTTEAV